MRVSLVGMSGSGKTYWSKKFEENGFVRFCCDDIIEKKLENELKPLGYSGIADVSKWMGQPYDTRYEEASQKYLTFERETMQEIFEVITALPFEQNVIIDTTGSVIYTGDVILSKLLEISRVIYLETSQSVQKEMYELYIRDPKPVIWGTSFNKKIGETDMEALARCYPQLLEYRSKKYAQHSHKTVVHGVHKNPNTTIQQLLA